MIKAQELRIGNLVQSKEGIELDVFNILQSYIRGHCSNDLEELQCDYSDINPIPLTEEWLLKFGLDYKHHIIERRKNGFGNDVVLEIEFNGVDDIALWITYDGEDVCTNFNLEHRLKYVHQLQNLYFALAGKEL